MAAVARSRSPVRWAGYDKNWCTWGSQTGAVRHEQGLVLARARSLALELVDGPTLGNTGTPRNTGIPWLARRGNVASVDLSAGCTPRDAPLPPRSVYALRQLLAHALGLCAGHANVLAGVLHALSKVPDLLRHLLEVEVAGHELSRKAHAEHPRTTRPLDRGSAGESERGSARQCTECPLRDRGTPVGGIGGSALSRSR
jgi:hypothetical protein